MTEPRVRLVDVVRFLDGVHDGGVRDVEPLTGGFWSTAYAYGFCDRELVLRLGAFADGFEMDRAAMAFARPGLPVPDVLEIGEAFDGAYAISVRHRGRYLELVEPTEAAMTGPALMRLLHALRSVEAPPGASAHWWPDGDGSTWRGWLAGGLVDDPAQRVSGWRAKIADDPDLDRLFGRAEQRIHDLLPRCPERRDLVHGDLLHGNVLLAGDGAEVSAVFSWKCSVRGDFLFDVAWCTFWGAWHPGVAAIDVWDRTRREVPADDLDDAALRHHCYELQIGTSHLGWYAWTDDRPNLDACAARVAARLDRGPLDDP